MQQRCHDVCFHLAAGEYLEGKPVFWDQDLYPSQKRGAVFGYVLGQGKIGKTWYWELAAPVMSGRCGERLKRQFLTQCRNFERSQDLDFAPASRNPCIFPPADLEYGRTVTLYMEQERPRGYLGHIVVCDAKLRGVDYCEEVFGLYLENVWAVA
ncbi:hypothetical protein C8R46DRAFT_1030231 [Mycena filopes]|nr:hypothetical protein C8R46DRAFT_1030231 [Mycena filopes]